MWGKHLLCHQSVAAGAEAVHPTGSGRRGVPPRKPQGTLLALDGPVRERAWASGQGSWGLDAT